MTEPKSIDAAINLTGLVIIGSSVVGFIGESLGWLTFSSFLPWIGLLSTGVFLSLAKGRVRDVLKSVEILGTKIQLQETATEKAVQKIESATQRIVEIEAKISVAAEVQNNVASKNSVAGVNFVQIMPSNLEPLLQVALAASRSADAPPANYTKSADQLKASTAPTLTGYKPQKPSYLQFSKD